jgi:hypothetical protein
LLQQEQATSLIQGGWKMIGTLVIGALMGGAVAYLYGDQLRGFLDDKTRTARTRAADTLQSAAEGLHSAKETAKETFESGFGGRERSAR